MTAAGHEKGIALNGYLRIVMLLIGIFCALMIIRTDALATQMGW